MNTGQAIDELGMICASLAFLYVVLEVGHLETRRNLERLILAFECCLVATCS